ncbi:MAG: sugar phosphate isomerase/epimerase [Clostridia bacterium]|nr:sugar phosphate isomerase/epimerase [Clostridia bacterium]
MELLLSTGTFIGRINDRNFDLLPEHKSDFKCDGFEFMIFPGFYPKLDEITEKYLAAKINIPVMHFDKDIGDGIGSESSDEYANALKKLEINLDTANALGTKKAVIHLWGRTDSDKNSDIIYKRAGEVKDICLQKGVLPVFENIFCCVSSPLYHLENLASIYPDMRFIIDSRPAQFHGELEKTLKSPIMQRVKHLHINDYAGGYKEWAKVNPIPQPQKGVIDWKMYFDGIKNAGYDGTVTLEAPAHLPVGVDSETLNASLDFIRKNMFENGE